MKLLKTVIRVSFRQTKNVIKLMLRKPLNQPSFGSVTLDVDDIEIARQYLGNCALWNNYQIIRDFEKSFAAWNGSHHAYSFMGGRVALSACIYALGLNRNDEVIIPGYTCVVVPNAFWYEGINPSYCDIELETYGLNFEDLKRKITNQTKAILLHHLYGLVSRDYEKIVSFAKERGIYVIEDCAHSAGASLHGKKVGNLGDVAFYSTEQSKILTTFNGGMAVTNSSELAKRIADFQKRAPFPDENRIRALLDNVIYNYYAQKHPQRWFLRDVAWLQYGKQILSSTTEEENRAMKPAHYGQKMPVPLAAIGLNQLKKVDQYNHRRRIVAEQWDRWCQENNYQKPLVIDDSEPVYLRYPVLVTLPMKQDHSWAKPLNVPIGVWFMSHIHPSNFPVYGCPNADKAVTQCINFPTLFDE